jgi:hypothetical protein
VSPERPGRWFQPGDRVACAIGPASARHIVDYQMVGRDTKAAYGPLGIVTDIIRRNRPPFAGYAVHVGGRETELPWAQVSEPPRLLVEAYLHWAWEEDGLHQDYAAALPEPRFNELMTQWEEMTGLLRRWDPVRAAARERMRPRRDPDAVPLHYVRMSRITSTHRNRSSNGAFERTIRRYSWYLRCSCTRFEERTEWRPHAVQLRTDHQSIHFADSAREDPT